MLSSISIWSLIIPGISEGNDETTTIDSVETESSMTLNDVWDAAKMAFDIFGGLEWNEQVLALGQLII